MAIKLLNMDRFLSGEKSGPDQARQVKTAKTFTRNNDNVLAPASGSFYDPGIFGFSSKEIFDKFAYIKLEEPVIHPFIYKNIGKLGGLFNKCIRKSIKCIINNGMLEESANGSNGVSFIINNFSRIKFDKYKNEKNEAFIELLKNKNVIITKIPVIPIGYRNYSEKHGMIEEDEITAIYKKIVNINESKDWVKDLDSDGQNQFEKVIQSIYKNTSKKEYIQKYLQTLYDYFLDKLHKKDGFFNASLFGKRIDNVARYVANAQPDIPCDSAAFPWQGLLVMFDVFVIAYLNKPEYEQQSKLLGTYNSMIDEVGKKLEYIYRNTEEYLNSYPTHENIWIQLLTDIFNDNPELRVITKRDPGWSPVSWWTFKPLILTGVQYQLIVPSLIYAPIGGDSFASNYIIKETDSLVLDNERISISVQQNKKTYGLFNSFSLIQELGMSSETIDIPDTIPRNNSKNTPDSEEDLFNTYMNQSGIRRI